MKLPSLDELEDFGNHKDIDENTKEFEDLLSEFENGDLTINEQEYDEMIVDDDDFSKVAKVNTYVDDEIENKSNNHSEENYNINHLDEEVNSEQNSFIEEDESEINSIYEYEENELDEKDNYDDGDSNNDESNVEDIYDESDDSFSFLPSVNDSDEDNFSSINDEEKSFKEDKNLKLNRDNNENDLDEKAKVFFTTLKNKVLNLFKKDKKRNSPKKLKKDSEKKKLKERKPLDFKELNKKTKITVLITFMIAVSIGIFYFLKDKNVKHLDEMNYTYKENDSLVVLQDFEHNENELTLKAKNEGEVSESLSIELSFETKENEVVVCKSDIIHLELGETLDLSLSCTNTFENEKYKLSTSIESYK